MEVPGQAARPKLIGVPELRALPALKAYTDSELDTLVAGAQGMSFPKGWLLCREGAVGQSCFLIIDGEVEVLKALRGGPRVLATLRPGAVAGQMALVDRAPRSASVRAAVDTLALELTRESFDGLLAAKNSLALRFQEQIAVAGIRQLRVATERLLLLLGRRREPEQDLTLAYVQAAVNEWDVPLGDLDQVVVVVPDGVITQAELRMRR